MHFKIQCPPPPPKWLDGEGGSHWIVEDPGSSGLPWMLVPQMLEVEGGRAEIGRGRPPDRVDDSVSSGFPGPVPELLEGTSQRLGGGSHWVIVKIRIQWPPPAGPMLDDGGPAKTGEGEATGSWCGLGGLEESSQQMRD